MIHLIYLSILAIGALLWALRERERRRGFNAAVAESKALREKVNLQANTLAKIEDLLRRTKDAGMLTLSGPALPPATAESNGAALVRVTTALRA